MRVRIEVSPQTWISHGRPVRVADLRCSRGEAIERIELGEPPRSAGVDEKLPPPSGPDTAFLGPPVTDANAVSAIADEPEPEPAPALEPERPAAILRGG